MSNRHKKPKNQRPRRRKPARSRRAQRRRQNNSAANVGRDYGGKIGAFIGEHAGRLFTSVTGMGDYKVKSNSIIHGNAERIPHFSTNGSSRFRHSEYLSAIKTSEIVGEYKVDKYTVNPGNSKTFPWFSGIAAQYTSYKIHGLIFMYQARSGDSVASTNTSLGKVAMATNYDVLSDTFPDMRTLEQYEFSNSTLPSEDAVHGLECAPSDTPQTILYTSQPGVNPDTLGEDRRFHDLGNFQIATEGHPGTEVHVGDLWVTYDIELLKPKARTISGPSFLAAVAPCIGQGVLTSGELDTLVYQPSNDIPIVFDTDGVFIDRPGRYELNLLFSGKEGSTVVATSGWTPDGFRAKASTVPGHMVRRPLVPGEYNFLSEANLHDDDLSQNINWLSTTTTVEVTTGAGRAFVFFPSFTSTAGGDAFNSKVFTIQQLDSPAMVSWSSLFPQFTLGAQTHRERPKRPPVTSMHDSKISCKPNSTTTSVPTRGPLTGASTRNLLEKKDAYTCVEGKSPSAWEDVADQKGDAPDLDGSLEQYCGPFEEACSRGLESMIHYLQTTFGDTVSTDLNPEQLRAVGQVYAHIALSGLNLESHTIHIILRKLLRTLQQQLLL